MEIPWALEDALPADLVQGATVKVRGILTYTSIENYEEGIFGRIENIELIPMSPSAVEVVRRAPFFTAERLLFVLAWVLALLGALFVWTLTLRRMVSKRSAELAESIRLRETARIEADAARRERLRLAADLHDGFQQYLAGAMFRLKAAMNYLPEGADACRAQLDKVNDALKHTQSGLRSTLWAMNEESEGPESLIELMHFVPPSPLGGHRRDIERGRGAQDRPQLRRHDTADPPGGRRQRHKPRTRRARSREGRVRREGARDVRLRRRLGVRPRDGAQGGALRAFRNGAPHGGARREDIHNQRPRGGLDRSHIPPAVTSRAADFGIISDKAERSQMKDLKEAYKTIEADHFAPKMEISFIDGASRQTFQYEKVTWNIGGEEKGLRYGENPGQEASLYRLVNGNLVLGDVERTSRTRTTRSTSSGT